MEGIGWQAQGIKLELNQLTTTDFILHLTIAQLQLPFLNTPLQQLSIVCPHVYYTVEKILCTDGELTLAHEILAHLPTHLTFSYDFSQQQIHLTVTAAHFADGRLDLSLQTGKNGWQGEMHLRQINLTKINELLSQPLTMTGYANLQITAKQFDEKQQIDITGTLEEGNFANTDFTQAAENLSMNLNLQAIHLNNQWDIQGESEIQQGGIYSEPIYASFNTAPAKLIINLSWQENTLIIQQLNYQHGDAIDLTAKATFDFSPLLTIKALSIQAKSAQLQNLYESYLASWLETTALKSLTLLGAAEVKLEWTDISIYFLTTLYHVTLIDPILKMGLLDLNGTVQWHNYLSNLFSQLYWSSGYIATTIPLGASQINMQLVGKQATLLKPFNLPILDGALVIEQFDLNHLTQKELQWKIKGNLLPISLKEVTAALNLPEMAGKIATTLPLIHYENQKLTVDGKIMIDLFDGQITIDQLKIKNPFTHPSQLTAEIKVDQLNLAKLTHITKFGEIQGELSGFIKQLVMIDWQPISFNANFATPENSVLPRTISQKAIDNLTNLGGGGTVDTLSRAILSLFEKFYYQKLGWGCLLKNEICHMQGIDSHEKGYYIIKGGGLPRIDIIGYHKEVDWQILLTRLKRILHLQSPVIQ